MFLQIPGDRSLPAGNVDQTHGQKGNLAFCGSPALLEPYLDSSSFAVRKISQKWRTIGRLGSKLNHTTEKRLDLEPKAVTVTCA